MMHAIMNDENSAPNGNSRITRARAKALNSSLPPRHPSVDNKRVLRAGLKRAASENDSGGSSAALPQSKKRAVLKDVTNINCDTFTSCINAAKRLVSLLPILTVKILFCDFHLFYSPSDMMSLESNIELCFHHKLTPYE